MKHCAKCSMEFYMGKPKHHKDNPEKSRCPDCQLVFSHSAVWTGATPNIKSEIRCWVEPTDSSGLHPGKFPFRRKVA